MIYFQENKGYTILLAYLKLIASFQAMLKLIYIQILPRR